jgi:hypothetical protein
MVHLGLFLRFFELLQNCHIFLNTFGLKLAINLITGKISLSEKEPSTRLFLPDVSLPYISTSVK